MRPTCLLAEAELARSAETQPGSDVLFPGDLSQTSGALLTLAGRVVRVQGRLLWLADAFAHCEVELDGEADPALLGAWLKLRGRLDNLGGRPRLSEAVILSRHPGKFNPDGQFARFSGVGRNLKRRAQALSAAREFFVGQGYLEVTTPVRVLAPGTDVYLEPQACGDQWLITSPEFHLKRLLVGGLPRIFEFAACTRRDEVGPWHQPEFQMLEWYRLYQTFDQLLDETEALVMHLARALGAGPALKVDGKLVQLERGFERITVSEAFRSFARVDDVVSLAADNEDEYFQLMVDKVDPALARLPRPVLLTHYPLSQAALSTPSPDHSGCAERFELFIGGIELCNGYGELTCSITQRQRFEDDVRKRRQKGLASLPIDEGLLAALDEGMPPCSGNAVGFDRLVAVLLDQPLAEVVSFPAVQPQ